MDIEKE
jgi:hypothetical protein